MIEMGCMQLEKKIDSRVIIPVGKVFYKFAIKRENKDFFEGFFVSNLHSVWHVIQCSRAAILGISSKQLEPAMEEVIASSQTNIVEESPAPVETINRVIKTVSFKKQNTIIRNYCNYVVAVQLLDLG